jgi:hypothetical protein
VLSGFVLLYARMPVIFGRGPDTVEYRAIAVMAVSVLCLWSSVRFLVLNRYRGDRIYLIVFLAPIMLIALYVTGCYIAYVMETYARIHRYESRW